MSIRGATGFEDLLTVNGDVQESFQDACRELGLTSGDCSAYIDALAEVVIHGSPWQIRFFFATLVAQCNPSNITEMWIKHRTSMADDYRRTMTVDGALIRARSTVLRMIGETSSELMIMMARKLTLPTADGGEMSTSEVPEREAPENEDVNQSLPNEDGPDQEHDDGHIVSLNREQRAVFDAVMQSAANGNRNFPNIFSLMAPAGTGKTHVYLAMLTECKRQRIPFIATAFTAIAALILLDGETCHKAFGIPIKARCDGTDRSFIEAASPEGEALSAAQIVLIDESSMLAKWQLQLIDHLFRVSVFSYPSVFYVFFLHLFYILNL